MIIMGVTEAHDASACLMIDGEVIAAAQEERWTGLKGDYGLPVNAIKFCMEFAGVKADDIDIVALASHNWNPVLTKIKRNANFSVSDWIQEQHDFWRHKLGINKLAMCGSEEAERESYYDIFKDRSNFKYDSIYDMDHLLTGYMNNWEMEQMRDVRIQAVVYHLGIPAHKVRFIKHEDCHTFYSYYGSHLAGEEVLALTAEGSGDYSNSTVSIFTPNGRTEISYSTENHLGHIYQYITLILGMKPAQHEYKVMGLAPYANEYEVRKSYKAFHRILKVAGTDIVFWDKPKDLYFHFREALEGHRFDGIAGGLQAWLEEMLNLWVRCCVEKTGIRKLVCSGGVFQNIKAGKAISELECVDDISILPATGDTSLSIGACYYQNGGGKPLEHMYLGPDVVNHPLTKGLIGGMIGDKTIEKSGAYMVAKLLSEGKIIARCAGRMEFGQRALGNRSILADPRNPAIVEKLNKAIKRRDFWMPFTPSILEDSIDNYIIDDKGLDARFMCMAFESSTEGEKVLSAAIHPADKTIRPQLVDWNTNPEYHAIIKEFKDLTGVAGILNTSFNLHGEPIVLGAEDALRVFENSAIDYLILGDYLIGKRN